MSESLNSWEILKGALARIEKQTGEIPGIQSDIIVIKGQLATIQDMQVRHSHAIDGNGSEGLKARVSSLEAIVNGGPDEKNLRTIVNSYAPWIGVAKAVSPVVGAIFIGLLWAIFIGRITIHGG